MGFQKKRWISLWAAVIIEVLTGIAYAWSVFQTPLIEKYGWSVSGLSLGFTFAFLTGMFFSMFFGAKLRQKITVRKSVFVGSFLYAGGIFLMAFIRSSLWELYLYWSIISAIGAGMIYPILIGYALELFPEKTGFAGGIATAGYGLGAVIWAPLTSTITAATGDIGKAFMILGVVFFVGIAALSNFLYMPPAGFREQMLGSGMESTQKKKKSGVIYDVGKQEMVKKPIFYFMMLSLLIGLSCGSMVVTQGSPIMQLTFGMATTTAAVIVSVLSAANTIGRILWGTIADRLGKVNTLVMIHAAMLCCMILLLMIKNQAAFVVALSGVTLCYGGLASMVAPTTEEIFGGTNIAANYSISYCAIGLSGLFGPMVISNIRQSTGAYTLGFAFAVAISILALVITVVMILKIRSIHKNVKITV